jgi:putative hydrolase of the HAD superfamily
MSEPTPVIRLVSFDVWGTLLRGNPVFKARREALVAEAFGTGTTPTADAMATADGELDADTLRTGNHYGCAERLERAADVLGVPPLPNAALVAVEAGLTDALSTDPPTLTEPDLPDTLGRLRTAGLGLAVTSNTGFLTGVQMRPVLTGLGLRVEHYVFSDEVGRSKPAPEIFNHLAGTAGCRPAEILHVGDNEVADVRGALGAGLQARWYRPDAADQPGVVTSIRELVSGFDHLGPTEA